jgi:signal transduction histidine kinase
LDHNTEDTVIDVSVFKKDSFINIIIEDNGQGIGEEDLKNIFNRYYRGVNSSSKSKGSGLGMAISKEIITWHKGDIKVLSEIGKGTKIEIFFEEIKENHVK